LVVIASILTFLLPEINLFCFNVVGGIYTVLRSKADSAVEELGEDFCMVGICNERFVAMEVDKMDLTLPQLKRTVERMREEGIKVCALEA